MHIPIYCVVIIRRQGGGVGSALHGSDNQFNGHGSAAGELPGSLLKTTTATRVLQDCAPIIQR